jgi:hypothetical protein
VHFTFGTKKAPSIDTLDAHCHVKWWEGEGNLATSYIWAKGPTDNLPYLMARVRAMSTEFLFEIAAACLGLWAPDERR